MTTEDLRWTGAAELSAAYAAGEVSPVEATEAALAAIEAHDGAVNAFCLVERDSALASARETALSEMQDRAAAVGGNAVVGVDLDYEVINNMLMVSASGTAVTAE